MEPVIHVLDCSTYHPWQKCVLDSGESAFHGGVATRTTTRDVGWHDGNLRNWPVLLISLLMLLMAPYVSVWSAYM